MKTRLLISFLLIILSNIFLFAKDIYKWDLIHPSFDSLATCLEKVAFEDGNREKLYPVVFRMYELAGKNRNLQARALYWEAWIQILQNKDSASLLIEKAISLLIPDTLYYKYDHARMLFVKGDIFRQKGEWVKAYTIFKKAESCFKQCEDDFYVGKISVALGVVLCEMGIYKEALQYLEKAEKQFIKVGSKQCEVKNKLNIANVYYQLREKIKAVEVLKLIVKNPVVKEDTSFLINAMVSLCSISDYTEDYSWETYKMAKGRKNVFLLPMALTCRAAHFLYRRENDSALAYYRLALESAEENKDVYNLLPILNGLSEMYSRLGFPDSAYYYLRKFNNHRDSLLAGYKMVEVNKLESRAAVEKYEIELRQADEKARLHKKIIILIGCVFICILVLMGYIFKTLKNREKMKRKLRESEARELAVKLRNETLEKERYLVEIGLKNRELTSNTLMLTEKNQILRDLLQQIQEYGKSGILSFKETNDLQKRIKLHLGTDEEWKFFKLRFEQVHPTFFSNLKEKFRGLSESDLRLCAYIRIGMSKRQTAQLLSVLPETINTTRYRIRKKLGLGQDESLEDFLRSL